MLSSDKQVQLYIQGLVSFIGIFFFFFFFFLNLITHLFLFLDQIK